MLFVTSNGGQLCNKIWSFASIIAYSKAHKNRIVLVDFDEYQHLFPNLLADSKIQIFPYKKFGWVFKKLMRLIEKLKVVTTFEYKALHKGLIKIEGWEYRFDTTYFNAQNIAYIKSIFTPHTQVIEKCTSLVNQQKKNDTILVGLHIRRGDYLQFANGRFYYSNSDYLMFMLQMQNLLKRPLTFLICSNEKVDLNDFKPVRCCQLDNSTAIEDLYALSLCDYIIGPHSTFSMWSSFYGNKPLKLVLNKHEEFTLEDFKVFLS